ncbi:glycosyltransferase family 4 protein [Pedobacter aquatilis]|uniref:glycosyltransferase family 4 protein n=1 Tax=Pedobacter aquatilis TaxID=351343 RepID=UPI00293050FD|nr:glycosyltransferase family 4 protein [Pedobacter aquatilis]
MKKLAIISTHPIQYYAPVFKLLAEQCKLKVFYTAGIENAKETIDNGFKKKITWDIPLLDGYEYEFLENKAKEKGTHHYSGIKNPDIIEKISENNPDAILVYGWPYSSHLKVLRYFKGKIPIYFRGDSHLLDSKPVWKKLARKALLTWVYSYVDKAFYVGKANKVYFKEFGLKEEQLVFAPHAVDNERFSEDRSNEVKHLRESLYLTSNDKLILFAGKLEEKKSPQLLLNAFLDLNLENTHLLFVGSGESEENLKLKVEKILRQAKDDIHRRIHFMDFQNQSYMPVIYQACDLFCLPSKGPNETWGLAVNEAMAAGKGILVSDKVGCSQDIITEHNGYIFENENILSFKQGLKSLLYRNLHEMGQSSEKIICKWTFEDQVKKIIKELNHE